MGCMNRKSIKVYPSTNFNKPKNINDIKRECFNFYKKNLFFKYDNLKINTLVNQYQTTFNYNLSNLLEKTSITKIEKMLFHEIHLNFYSKLSFSNDVNQIKSIVFELILLFLSNDKDLSNQQAKRVLLEKTISNFENPNSSFSYNTEKLTNCLHLIIQLSLACMVYLVFSFVLIEKSKYEKVFDLNDPSFDIEKVCLKLMILIEKEFYKINNEITDKNVESICYSYVFKEINDLITNDLNIVISKSIFDKVINSLIVLYSPYNLLDAFFNLSLNHIC